MKQLLALACCLLLAGCSGFVFPGPEDAARMEGSSEVYPPGVEGGYEPPPANERMTSTCTMKGQVVICR